MRPSGSTAMSPLSIEGTRAARRPTGARELSSELTSALVWSSEKLRPEDAVAMGAIVGTVFRTARVIEPPLRDAAGAVASLALGRTAGAGAAHAASVSAIA